MKITAEPRSDQINADDFVGGARTFTIAKIEPGRAEKKYDISLAEVDGRYWRPPLTVLRLMIAAWGDEASNWIGQKVTLYRDPDVRFGSDLVGGVRISHMTNLPGNQALELPLAEKRGRRAMHTVQPLVEAPTQPRSTEAIAAFKAIGVTVEQLTAKLGGRTPDTWTDADIDGLSALFGDIQNRVTSVEVEFGGGES